MEVDAESAAPQASLAPVHLSPPAPLV
jgi:hypothetical protein